MRVLVAGLTPQSAAAVERVVESAFDGARIVLQPRGPTLALPALAAEARRCDLCIVDLMGFGWARWSPELDREIRVSILPERRSILFVPPGDGGGWLSAAAQDAGGPSRVLLQHPVTVAALRAALPAVLGGLRHSRGGAAAGAPAREPALRRIGAAAGAASALPIVPVKKGLGRLGAPLAPASAWPGSGAPTAAIAAFRVDQADFAALLAACPDAARDPYVNLVCGLAMKDAPHEFRLGSQTGAVFCPAENWVASNISMPLRKRVSQHRAMLQIVQARELPADTAAEHARALYGRRSDGRRPLDSFVWAQVFGAFAEAPPKVGGDLCFRLLRFPNFTRLPKSSDLFLQLALVSMRQAQTIKGLQSAFSRHDPRLVTLFVACAVLSGMATVLPQMPSARPEPRPPARTQPKRGFLRSLLAKLF